MFSFSTVFLFMHSSKWYLSTWRIKKHLLWGPVAYTHEWYYILIDVISVIIKMLRNLQMITCLFWLLIATTKVLLQNQGHSFYTFNYHNFNCNYHCWGHGFWIWKTTWNVVLWRTFNVWLYKTSQLCNSLRVRLIQKKDSFVQIKAAK